VEGGHQAREDTVLLILDLFCWCASSGEIAEAEVHVNRQKGALEPDAGEMITDIDHKNFCNMLMLFGRHVLLYGNMRETRTSLHKALEVAEKFAKDQLHVVVAVMFSLD
jgi:hypothetical protein